MLKRVAGHGGAATGRSMRRLFAAATIVVGIIASGGPARADHIVAYTMSASNCLPGGVICARITTVFHYHETGGLGKFTFRTTAAGSALVLPGTFEARRTITVEPNDPDPLTATGKCGWDILGSGCALALPDLSTGQFPPSFCGIVRFDLSATARAIDDPVLRLLPVNARATRDLKLCWNGTVSAA